jgi:predicted esterase
VGDPVDVRVGCVLPGMAGASVELRNELFTAGRAAVASSVSTSRVSHGTMGARVSIDVPAIPSGMHVLKTTVSVKGKPVLTTENDLYVAGADVFELLYGEQPPQQENPLVPSFEIRQAWILEFLREATPMTNPAPLREHVSEARRLLDILRQPKPVWSERGTTFRFAHRSAIDGRLQPYSLYVPGNYNPAKPPPLVVTLHGSGVNERNTIKAAVRRYKDSGWMILAPQARGLSDWYLGPAGEDVIESMKHVATFLPFDSRRVLLEGFSMGGYGAWRLALTHPRTFAAVAVQSGSFAPHIRTPSDESVAALLNSARRSIPPFFVVHGARDQAVPIGPVNELVRLLRKKKVRHEFVELPEAGHANYDADAQVLDWFRGHAR